MTGFGQEGPLAKAAGHDINYVALSGALHPMGRAGEKPAIPLNLVGDFGGGGLMLAYGMVCALLESKSSGQGQVVDSAMIDGAATLMTSTFAAQQIGFWKEARGTNLLDGSAPFYRCYTCADGRFVAVGAIEPQFFAALLAGLSLEGEGWDQNDRTSWPRLSTRIAEVFATRSRDDWAARFEGTDACVSPVLGMAEAPGHPHNIARGTFTGPPDQPAPGPRFSNHPTTIRANLPKDAICATTCHARVASTTRQHAVSKTQLKRACGIWFIG